MRKFKLAQYFLLIAFAITTSIAASSPDAFLWIQQEENDVSFSNPNHLSWVIAMDCPEASTTGISENNAEEKQLFRYKRTTDFQPIRPNKGIRQRGTTIYSEDFEPKNDSGELPTGWEIMRNTLANGGLNGNNLVTAVSPFWFRGSIDHLYGDDWVVYVRTGEASL